MALALPAAPPALSRRDFFVSPANALALAVLDGWRAWPGGRMVLAGPPRAGKTHLARIWAEEAGAAILPAEALEGADLPALAAAPLALEDAERVAGRAGREEALLHLLNLAQDAGGPVLMTAALPPRDWGLTLPDLASRVQAAGMARLDPPDDALLSAVLVKLFADRQVAVAPALVPWLLLRMDRSFDAASTLVAALDAEALAGGRAITRAMAAVVLERMREG